MRTITLQDLKRHGANAIPHGKAIYLIVNSRPRAVLVPPEEYEALIDMLEEFEDIRAIEERRGEPTVRWGKVFPKKKR